MSIKFNPTGYLNLTADPMDLPEKSDGKVIISDALTRCKNIDLIYEGKAKTRRGSSKKSDTALTQIADEINLIGSNRYALGGGEVFYNESSIGSGYANAPWDSIVGKAYNDTAQTIFACNGTNNLRLQGGVAYSWSITAPDVAPAVEDYVTTAITCEWELDYYTAYQFTQPVESNINCCFTWEVDLLAGDTPENHDDNVSTAFGEETGTTGSDTYYVVYTYARKSGDLLLNESNPSPATSTNIEDVLYVNWTASADSQVTHVRVYRTLANLGDYYYAGEFEVAPLWGQVDTADEDLGSLIEIDNDIPPLGTVLAGPDFNGTVFMGYNNLLYFCKPKQPESWPALHNIECGPDQYSIKAMAILGGQLYVATEPEIFQITGTDADTFFPLSIGAITGTRAKNVFLPIKGYGIVHLGWDGLYMFTGSADIKISSSIASIWNNETKNGVPPMAKDYIANCLCVKAENNLWFGYPSGTEEHCNNFIVVDLQANLMQGLTSKISYYTYPFVVSAMHYDEINAELLATDTDGYVRILEDQNTTSDSGSAISWEVESKAFGSLRKYFPRWSRYDIDLTEETSTAQGKILLNDVIKQTHNITTSRIIKKRLIDGCTGDRLSIRLTGTGPVTIYAAEAE